MFDFKVTWKKNVLAFSTEQNETVVIQSAYSKVGTLAASFAQWLHSAFFVDYYCDLFRQHHNEHPFVP